jgi:hypothetical protein
MCLAVRLASSSTLIIEAICFSETPVNFTELSHSLSQKIALSKNYAIYCEIKVYPCSEYDYYSRLGYYAVQIGRKWACCLSLFCSPEDADHFLQNYTTSHQSRNYCG